MRAYGHGSNSPREPHFCCPGHTSWAMPSRYNPHGPRFDRDASRRPWKKAARQGSRFEVEAGLIDYLSEQDELWSVEVAWRELERDRDMDELYTLDALTDGDWDYDAWTREDYELRIQDAEYYDSDLWEYSWDTDERIVAPRNPLWVDLWLDGKVNTWEDYNTFDDWFDWCDYDDGIPDAPWADSGNNDSPVEVGTSPAEDHQGAKYSHSLRRKQKYGK